MLSYAERLRLIKRFFEEGGGYMSKGDSVQASEKFYKVGEECVKALAERYVLPEYEEAVKVGRWTVMLLFKAVDRLSDKIDGEIRHWWDAAWALHVEGFHEARLDIESMRMRERDIERLVQLVKQYVKK